MSNRLTRHLSLTLPNLRRARWAVAAGALVFVTAPLSVSAQTDPASPGPSQTDAPTEPETENTSAQASPPKSTGPAAEANAAFIEGNQLARSAQWASALASFERAAALVPHPITTYNIGTCERALGRYAAARETFRNGLTQHQVGEAKLPGRLVEDIEAYLSEIEASLSRVRIRVTPSDARLAIDGRPVQLRDGSNPIPVVVAGVRAPGPGEVPPAGTFDLELDPGRHVFTFQRAGFSDVIVRRDFSPGANPEVTLALNKLPAVVRIQSNVEPALVTLDGRDLGPTPVMVKRPAGPYQLRVESDGYEVYESEIAGQPGQEVDLTVRLVRETPDLYERWWFWTAAVAVVAGAAVTTYAITRDDPEPERQPVDGGTLGWRIPIP